MSRTRYLKGECQQCGGRIEYPAETIGTAVACPHCGQETELTLEAPPQEPALPRRVVAWTVSGVAVLVLALLVTVVGLKWFENYAARQAHKRGQPASAGAAPAPAADAAAPEDPIAKAGFEISPVALERTAGTTLVYVVGTLKNAAARQRFGVRIEFELLDAAGDKVGAAKDYLSMLEPNGQWRFKALVVEAKAVSARVASIKEDQ